MSNQDFLAGDAPAVRADLIFIDVFRDHLAADAIGTSMSINLSGDMAPGLLRGFGAAAAGIVDFSPCTHLDD